MPQDAPNAVITAQVASMSFDVETPVRCEAPPDSAAQMIARCAMLLEAGTETVPDSRWGVMTRSIAALPFKESAELTVRCSFDVRCADGAAGDVADISTEALLVMAAEGQEL